MRAVVQRVLQAEVKVNNQQVGKIDTGLLVYLSVGKEDTLQDAGFPNVAVTVEPRKGWICVVSELGPNDNAKECAKRDTA